MTFIRAWLLTCTGILSVAAASGQLLFPDARSMGKGNAVSAEQGIHELFFNPAGMHGNAREELLLTLSMPYSRLGLRGLGAAYMRRVGEYFVGGGLEAFGDDLYQQTRVALGMTRDFGDFQLGIRPEWSLESIQGSRSWFTLTAGSQWDLSARVRLGFAFRQLIRSEESLLSPSSAHAGILWQTGEKFTLSGEYVTNESGGIFSLGMTYLPVARIHFLGGLRMNPVRVFMGIRYGLARRQVDYAIGIDPVLGSMHALSVRWLTQESP